MDMERRRQLTKASEALFLSTKSAVDTWDPYGLLEECHCPPDEYDSESRDVAFRIRKDCDPTVDEIALIISDVFSHWFSDPERFRPEDCLIVAGKIEAHLKSSKNQAEAEKTKTRGEVQSRSE